MDILADREAEAHADVLHRPSYSVLCPNLKGYKAARAAGADEVAVFCSASESHSLRDINCSIEEAFERFAPVVDRAARDGVAVRGYISCATGCPIEGWVDPVRVSELTSRLIEMGCYQVSLADTCGESHPGSVIDLLEAATGVVSPAELGFLPYDTFGQALPNLHVALQAGITSIDTSIAGLGTGPIPGTAGCISTEDAVYMLHGMGIETGVDMDRLRAASAYICKYLQRQPRSSVAAALKAKDDARAEEKAKAAEATEFTKEPSSDRVCH